ncbi:MAG: helix-turn-helix domain-containing protein [bacterium]|nr:helix-turn-helix domain-containing protein [bacterium]
MKNDMYTVDEAADTLGLHPKTIRRFIREEKLKAHKVGGQWRIMDADLKSFMGVDKNSAPEAAGSQEIYQSPESPAPSRKEKIQVSSIVDVFVEDSDEAMRISNSIFAILNCKDPAFGKARCDYIFYDDELKARFILWGTPQFISAILECFSHIS